MRTRWKALLLGLALLLVASFFAYRGLHYRGANAAIGVPLDSPYGFTDTVQNFTDDAVTDMHTVGLGWVRSQLDWEKIETAPGVYNWGLLDATVSRANAGGVKLVFPIRNAPDFHLTQTCTTADGQFSTTFPGVQDMVQFATAVATRYNGLNGHGFIDAIQIGSEDWDNAKFGVLSESAQCRQPSFYAPVLAAAYDAIKAVSPRTLVIGTSLFWKDPQHQHDWYTYLYTHGDAYKFDAGAFNYYMCNLDPNVGNDATGFPALNEILTALQEANSQNGVAKPMWITEVGWNINANNQPASCIVTQQQVAQYMQEVLDDARTSHGLISKVFWFTMDEHTNGDSITQDGTPTLAYTELQSYIQAHPAWPISLCTPTTGDVVCN
jgi:hypothetical protein